MPFKRLGHVRAPCPAQSLMAQGAQGRAEEQANQSEHSPDSASELAVQTLRHFQKECLLTSG